MRGGEEPGGEKRWRCGVTDGDASEGNNGYIPIESCASTTKAVSRIGDLKCTTKTRSDVCY